MERKSLKYSAKGYIHRVHRTKRLSKNISKEEISKNALYKKRLQDMHINDLDSDIHDVFPF